MKNFDVNPQVYDRRGDISAINFYNIRLQDKEISRLAKKYIEENSVVADLGCGTFAYEHHFKKARHIYALEKNKKMIEYGLPKEKGMRAKLAVINEDVLVSKSIPQDSVDICFAIGLLDYIEYEDHRLFFQKCWGILRRKGVLVLVVPNKFNLINLIYRLYCSLFGRYLPNVYSLGYLRKVVQVCRFSIIESKITGAQLWLPKFFGQKASLKIYDWLAKTSPLRYVLPGGLLLMVLQKKETNKTLGGTTRERRFTIL
jgi:SAM-dependent methyltransferase